MTITVDATTQQAAGTPFNHTTGIGASLLIFMMSVRAQSGTTASYTSATYNSVSLTTIGTYVEGGTNNRMLVFAYLKNPTAGTNSLAYTAGGTLIGRVAVVTLFGTNAASPLRASSYTTANGSSTTPSVTIPCSIGDLVFDATVASGTLGVAIVYTVDGSQTSITNGSAQSSNRMGYGMSREAATSASVVMGWTMDASYGWYSGGFAIAPAAASGQPAISPFLMF